MFISLVHRILEGADASSRRAQEIVEKAADIAAALESPATDPDNLLRGMSDLCKQYQDNHVSELKYLDGALRSEVQVITDAKVCRQVDANTLIDELQNAYTKQCIGVLRQISALNIDIVQLPTALSNLQAKFRAKNSFSHIQRLHNMLYAYGATVVEIVRRKEFGQSASYCVTPYLIFSIQLTFSISARKVFWK